MRWPRHVSQGTMAGEMTQTTVSSGGAVQLVCWRQRRTSCCSARCTASLPTHASRTSGRLKHNMALVRACKPNHAHFRCDETPMVHVEARYARIRADWSTGTCTASVPSQKSRQAINKWYSIDFITMYENTGHFVRNGAANELHDKGRGSGSAASCWVQPVSRHG